LPAISQAGDILKGIPLGSAKKDIHIPRASVVQGLKQ